jgi:hypothetical protein
MCVRTRAGQATFDCRSGPLLLRNLCWASGQIDLARVTAPPLWFRNDMWSPYKFPAGVE